jgi:hypothetical protein
MVVADAGPIIAFARIGRLDLLRQVIGELVSRRRSTRISLSGARRGPEPPKWNYPALPAGNWRSRHLTTGVTSQSL